MSNTNIFPAKAFQLRGKKSYCEKPDFLAYASTEIRGGAFRPQIELLEIAEMPYLLMTSRFELNANISQSNTAFNKLDIYLSLKSAYKLGKMLQQKYGMGSPIEEKNLDSFNRENKQGKNYPIAEEMYYTKFLSFVACVSGRPLAYQKSDATSTIIYRGHSRKEHKQRETEILISFEFTEDADFYESAQDYCDELKLLKTRNDETALKTTLEKDKNYSEKHGTGTGLMIIVLTRGQASDFGSALKKLASDNEQLKDD